VSRVHHRNAVRQRKRFLLRMGDEDDRRAEAAFEREQIVVELEARGASTGLSMEAHAQARRPS